MVSTLLGIKIQLIHSFGHRLKDNIASSNSYFTHRIKLHTWAHYRSGILFRTTFFMWTATIVLSIVTSIWFRTEKWIRRWTICFSAFSNATIPAVFVPIAFCSIGTSYVIITFVMRSGTTETAFYKSYFSKLLLKIFFLSFNEISKYQE